MIEMDDVLVSLCEVVCVCLVIVLDMEFVCICIYYLQLGLIQLFDGVNVVLIDLFGISDWLLLKVVLCDMGIIKFLYVGSEDLEVFLNVFGELLEFLIDM